MARLILINGAPGSGKSTLARRYVADHPLVLALDIDVVRALLGRWLEQPAVAGRLARRLGLAMAREHLSAGHDVVVPQFLGRLEFVLELEQLCDDVGARFVEVALLGDPRDVVDRFVRRTDQSIIAEHQDAAELLDHTGGVAALPAMCGRLLSVVASRPHTRTINTVDGHVDQAYTDLLAHLAA